MKLIFFPDVHNNPWFEKILATVKTIKDSKIISMGDIAAVETKEFLRNKEKYRAVWKYKKGKEVRGVTQKDIEWFDRLNREGWNKQIDLLEESKVDLTICMGNSDYAMLDWYGDKIKTSSRLRIIKKIKVFKFQKIFLIFLPYNSGLIKRNETKDIGKSDFVYVISHCPPMKESSKEYYRQIHINLVKLCKISKRVTLMHGHMHPDESYRYNLKDIKNLTVISPKSDDTEEGIGSHNHIIKLDSEKRKMKILDLNLRTIKLKNLPKKYYMVDRHWNGFNL